MVLVENGLFPKTAWEHTSPGGNLQVAGPGCRAGAPALLSVHQGDSAGQTDQLGGVLADGEVDEGLGGRRQLDSVVGDEVEGALDLVSTIQDGGLAALDALDGQGLDGVADGGQGGVADGQLVGGDGRDDGAGGGQLLVVDAGVLDADDALKAVAGAGAGLAADDDDLAISRRGCRSRPRGR